MRQSTVKNPKGQRPETAHPIVTVDSTSVTDLDSADVPLAMAGAAILRKQFQEIQSVEPGARLGEDIEAVHRMRVATRRLREALRVFTTDDVREAFTLARASASDIADALGAVRDLDVLHDDLKARAQANPADAAGIEVLLDALERVRSDRRQALIGILDSPVARGFLKTFPDTIQALEQSADPDATVEKGAPRLLRRRLKKVTRRGAELRSPTTGELHRLRIEFKRLRYACEFFEPWLSRRLKPVVEMSTKLQDTLGSLHDSDVLPQSLKALVDAIPVDRAPSGPSELALTRAILTLIQDGQRRRDELLVVFRDQRAALEAIHFTAK